MKDRLEKIIKDYDLSRKACNCPMIIPTDTLCADCVEGLSQKLLDSGYVHIDDVLECYDVSSDNYDGIDDCFGYIRQALENLGGNQ